MKWYWWEIGRTTAIMLTLQYKITWIWNVSSIVDCPGVMKIFSFFFALAYVESWRNAAFGYVVCGVYDVLYTAMCAVDDDLICTNLKNNSWLYARCAMLPCCKHTLSLSMDMYGGFQIQTKGVPCLCTWLATVSFVFVCLFVWRRRRLPVPLLQWSAMCTFAEGHLLL